MRTLLTKVSFSLVALAAVSLALLFLSGGPDRTALAVHGSTLDGTVTAVKVDMTTAGNSKNTLGTFDTCAVPVDVDGVAAGLQFDVDVVVEGLPAVAQTGPLPSEDDRLSAVSFRVQYDLSKLTVNTATLTGLSLLDFVAGSTLLPGGDLTNDGDISFGALDTTTASAENGPLSGIGMRVRFTVVGAATGAAFIRVLGDVNQTQLIQVDSDLFGITNLEPRTVSSPFTQQQSFAAITGGCEATSDISVVAGAATVTDGVNNCASTALCTTGETLTISYTAAVSSTAILTSGVTLSAVFSQNTPAGSPGQTTDCTTPTFTPVTVNFPSPLVSPQNITVSATFSCTNPSFHKFISTASVAFVNATGSDPNLANNSDPAETADFGVNQNVDIAITAFTSSASSIAGLGCSTTQKGAGGTVTYTATTIVDTSKAFTAAEVGRTVAVTPPTQTRLIVGASGTTLTVSPAFSPTPANFTSPYAVGDATNEVNAGDTLCANLGLAEFSFGGQNLSNLATLTTGATQPLTYNATVTDQTVGGASPAVNTATTVSLILGGTIDLAAGGAAGLDICAVTQPSPATTVANIPPTASPSYSGASITCGTSSFLDTDLNGSPNLKLQLVIMVATDTLTNLHVIDTDATDNSARVANLLGVPVAGNVFAVWSLPAFEVSPGNGGPSTGDYFFGSLIDDLAGSFLQPLPLSNSYQTLQFPTDPNDDDVCLISPSTCALGTFFAQGDQNAGAQGVGVDDDRDGVVDEADEYKPLAGSILSTPTSTGLTTGFFVQPGKDFDGPGTTFAGVSNAAAVGEFNATLKIDALSNPACSSTIAADLPPAGLFDAALPASQAFAFNPGGLLIGEGPDFAPLDTTAAAGSSTTTVNLSTNPVVAGVLNGTDVSSPPDGVADIGFFLAVRSGPANGQSRIIQSVSATGVTLASPLTAIPAATDQIRITAITSPDRFPTNLLNDSLVLALTAGLDGNPATADGPIMWYRRTGVAATPGNPTPVNSLSFNTGTSFLAVVTTSSPGLPGEPTTVTTVSCAPLVSESVTFDSVGATPLSICLNTGTQVFADTFVRSDTGGKILAVDTSTCTTESDVSVVAPTLDAAVTVASNNTSGSQESPPANPDADANNDREVTVVVTNGFGPIPASGVKVDVIAVSGKVTNDPLNAADDVDCEVRWNLVSVSLVQRLSVGDIDLDRVTYNTGVMGISATNTKTLSYTVSCTGNDANVGAGLPQVTAIIEIVVGGPPDPITANNTAQASTTATLETNFDADSFLNSLDNCPFTANDNQRNADANDPALGNDLTGNACDTNDDNDLVLDANESPNTGSASCTPGIPGPDRAALSAATLLTYQEDPDGAADTDGCRDVDLSVGYSGTTITADTNTATSGGPVAATVINNDAFIAASGNLVTSIISHSTLEAASSDPGCQVDIGGAGFTQDADLDLDGDIDHQSIRTDLLSLPSAGVTTISFNVTVNCPTKGSYVMTLNGATSVLVPFTDSDATNNTATHPVSANAFGKADLSVAMGVVSAGSLYVPGTPFPISIPPTVRNNGPDATGTLNALLGAVGADVANCTGETAPALGASAFTLAASTQTTTTATATITCTAAAASTVTFTFTDTVSLAGGSFLNDPNSLNNSAVKTVTLLKDTDGDGIADAADNCPTVSNVTQANTDGDALGDACDATPTHDVSASALSAPTNISVIRGGPATVMTVTATANNLSSTHAEEVTLALAIDQTGIPANCTATVLNSGNPLSLTDSNGTLAGFQQSIPASSSLNVSYQVSVSCTGAGTATGSIELTFGVTHVQQTGDGVETALADNSQSQTVGVTAF